MRVTIAGGSGLLGQALIKRLQAEGASVAVLTRHPRRSGDVEWNPEQRNATWIEPVSGADVVVNLAGESIAGGRWTPARKAALRDSRLTVTKALTTVLESAPRPPVFLSGSAVGYYGTPGDVELTEESRPGIDFLATLCRDWEAAASAAAKVTRVVLLRTGVVLSAEGGALPELARPFWFFVGGPVGSGRQYISWIHIDDWVAMTVWLMRHPKASGPFNVTAPQPVTNATMAHALGRTIRRPSLVRTPALPVRLALGEMADAAVLNGQRVIPARARAAGFEFTYQTLEPALAAIYRR